jgi:hypothetical protein
MKQVSLLAFGILNDDQLYYYIKKKLIGKGKTMYQENDLAWWISPLVILCFAWVNVFFFWVVTWYSCLINLFTKMKNGDYLGRIYIYIYWCGFCHLGIIDALNDDILSAMCTLLSGRGWRDHKWARVVMG